MVLVKHIWNGNAHGHGWYVLDRKVLGDHAVPL
jgi:hypothetical protein